MASPNTTTERNYISIEGKNNFVRHIQQKYADAQRAGHEKELEARGHCHRVWSCLEESALEGSDMQTDFQNKLAENLEMISKLERIIEDYEEICRISPRTECRTQERRVYTFERPARPTPIRSVKPIRINENTLSSITLLRLALLDRMQSVLLLRLFRFGSALERS